MRGLLRLLEPEELVGSHWHRLVGQHASWPRHPEAAATLESFGPGLATFFRAMGGAPGLKLGAAVADRSAHRLGLRQRLGLGQERIEQARRNDEAVLLPASIDVLPAAGLNRDLYLWLAAFLAHAGPPAPSRDDLQRDLALLAAAWAASRAAIAAFPGLAGLHQRLCAALRQQRPRRRLPPQERHVEAAVMRLLGEPGDGGPYWAVVEGRVPLASLPPAPRNHARFLPVPLWGVVESTRNGGGARWEDECHGGGSESGDERAHRAERRPADQVERRDSLILNRMEKLLSLVEQLNINRAVDDDDEAGARKALDDAETVSLSRLSRKAATRLRVDLDLAPSASEDGALHGELLYPEWDWARRSYHRDYCQVLATSAPETGEQWQPDAAAWRRIHRVRRQFEALRPRPVVLRAQLDGGELDLEAVVRSRADLLSSGIGSDRVHLAARRQARDLSVCLLVDASLSTDAWVANRRVLDIAKEALFVLAHGLDACGDEHAILTFSSNRREVRIEAVKDFGETLGAAVQRRISALRPGRYTRIGAAIRHSTAQLQRRPHQSRLLLVVTDGKPNDIDHYEGRYGVEDTAQAVREARRAGLAVFGVTIDRRAQSYFPRIFGRGGYTILSEPARLPMALPTLYRHLVAG